MPHYRDAPRSTDERAARYRNWDEHTDEERDAIDPYVDLVQRDPVVCDTCFLFRYDVLACEWWGRSLGWMDYEHWLPRPGRNVDIPADNAAQGTRMVCRNCGQSDIKARPIPKHLIDEYTENLSSTLRSKGIDHDESVLFSEVLALNDDSENQGRQDTHVFSPAVRKAIRAMQYRATSGATVADD